MRLTIFAASVALLAACSSTPPGSTPDAPGLDDGNVGDQVHGDMNGAPEPHLQPTRDARPGGGGSALMTSHGGSVMEPNVVTKAIFWGPSWSDTNWAGDKITGLDSFFDGYNGSAYAAASTEYYDATGSVTTNVVYTGHVLDSSSPPSKALSVSGAVAEVCKITNNAPLANAVYFIYTQTGAGHVSYCAWHSYGTCSSTGAKVQVAYMPNIDGIAGCDPQDTWTDHSEGLAALANVTSHELSEAITDPRNGGWYDSAGQENGDKCAWAFDAPVSFANGTTWKLQMEWSNESYTAGNGIPNRSGQKGCLQSLQCPSGYACGSYTDVAGHVIACGTCGAGSTCDGATHTCVCAPATTCPAGACGPQADGCGGTIDCGACPTP